MSDEQGTYRIQAPVGDAHQDPRSAAQQIADHRKARVVTIADADSFFTGLQQRIETLEQTRRQNPLSVELLVNNRQALSRAARTSHTA